MDDVGLMKVEEVFIEITEIISVNIVQVLQLLWVMMDQIVDPVKYLYQAFSNVVGKLEYRNYVVDDTHNLLTMARFMGSTAKTLRDATFKNLYALVCCVTFESVTQMDRTRRTNLWVQLKQTFNVLQNYPKTNRASQYLFSYFGTSLAVGTWPVGFLEYVQEKQNTKDSAQVFGPNKIIAKVGTKAARQVYYEQRNRSVVNTTTMQHPHKKDKR